MTAWTYKTSERGQTRRWVGASGSLSAHLAGAGSSGGFAVQVLKQGRQQLGLDEAHALGLPGPRAGYMREVVLRVDGVAVVFARSVTLHAHSQGPWRSIRGLGARPLADVLFRRSGISRSPLAFTRVKPSSRLSRNVARVWQHATGQPVAVRALPARRSVFTRCRAPLLVMEIFAAHPEPWCWSCSTSSAQPTFLPKKNP